MGIGGTVFPMQNYGTSSTSSYPYWQQDSIFHALNRIKGVAAVANRFVSDLSC